MLKTLFYISFTCFLVCALSNLTSAQKKLHFHPTSKSNARCLTGDQDMRDSAVKIIRSELEELLLDRHFTAISCAVSINGQVIQVHAGKLNDGKKPDSQTLYEIGSITKTYTGLLIAQAVHDHKLQLDADIRDYLGGKWPNLVSIDGQPITLRHLITHTSGLPMNINCNTAGMTMEEQSRCFNSLTKQDFFDHLAKLKIENETGKDYHYSNAGVQLAGYIVEKAYHSSFDALLKKYIFSRSLELRTFANLPAKANMRIAIGKDSLGISMPLENGGYLYAGGLKASTVSMSRYMNMYLHSHDPVIHQAEKLLAGNEQYGRAYVWNTFNYDKDEQMLYHNGGTFGTSSWIAIYPQKNCGIFLVTNVMTDDSQRRLNKISNKIFDRFKQAQLL